MRLSDQARRALCEQGETSAAAVCAAIAAAESFADCEQCLHSVLLGR